MLPNNKLLFFWYVKWLCKLWFPMQQVGKCGCGGLPVIQNYEIPGLKIKFWKFFCCTNFQ